MRSPSVWLTACSCALVLAGCGGKAKTAQPTLPRILAENLASRSGLVAERLDGHDCGGALRQAQALRRAVNAAVSAHGVPAPLEEQLQTRATDIVQRIRCAPPASSPNANGTSVHVSGNAKRDKHKDHKHGRQGDHGGGGDGGGGGD